MTDAEEGIKEAEANAAFLASQRAMKEAEENIGKDPEWGALLEQAKKRLKDGTWKEPVQKALDAKIAGEDIAKWIHFISAATSDTDNKLHIFLMGRSQRGKSFIQTQVGSIFGSEFVDLTEFSPKSFYYEVKAEGDPRLYDGKIVFIDEYADRSEDAQSFIKKATSNGVEELSLRSVAEQKFFKTVLEGPPTIWTNAMDLIEDTGNQKINRFFPLNVNEDLAQTRTVEQYQMAREEGMYDPVVEAKVIEATRATIQLIKEGRDLKTLNPFAKFIRLKDNRMNTRPMFNSLLSAITHCNWMARPIFESNGDNYVFPALSDVLEAVKIWRENEKYLAYSLPEYLLRFLAIFEPGKPQSKEEMGGNYADFYKGEAISTDSCGTYANELEKRDLLTSKYKDGEHYKEWTLMDNSNDSKKSSLELKIPSLEELATCLETLWEAGLMKYGETRDPGFEELAGLLIDVEIPKETDQPPLSDFYGKEK